MTPEGVERGDLGRVTTYAFLDLSKEDSLREGVFLREEGSLREDGSLMEEDSLKGEGFLRGEHRFCT